MRVTAFQAYHQGWIVGLNPVRRLNFLALVCDISCALHRGFFEYFDFLHSFIGWLHWSTDKLKISAFLTLFQINNWAVTSHHTTELCQAGFSHYNVATGNCMFKTVCCMVSSLWKSRTILFYSIFLWGGDWGFFVLFESCLFLHTCFDFYQWEYLSCCFYCYVPLGIIKDCWLDHCTVLNLVCSLTR